MLPSVQGYLLGTRQPIDFAGKALDAFTQVSAELRATRAQNLAESKEARAAGQQAFEQPMQAAEFQDDMMTSALDRELAIKDQQMQEADFAFRMQRAQWEQENLMPLKIQAEQARIQNYQSQAAERSYTLQSEMDMRRQFGQEADDLNRSLQLVSQGPQEGQDAEQYYESVRKTNALLSNLKQTWGSTGDPAVKGFLSAAEGRLSKAPGYRYLSARDDLKTAEERDAIASQRGIAIDAMIPFRSDADRNQWREQNQGRIDSWMRLDDSMFGKVIGQEATRVQNDSRYWPEPGDPEPRRNLFTELNQSDRELLAKRNAAVRNPDSRGEVEYGGTYIPIDTADQILRGLGFNDTHLLPPRREATDTGNSGIPRGVETPSGIRAQPMDGEAETFDPF